MGNFTFLEKNWPDLAKLGYLAERNVYVDSNTSMYKQGLLAENMVKYMLAYDGIEEPQKNNSNHNRIKLLKRNGLLPKEIDNTLYILRIDRNNAAHNGTESIDKAKENLSLAFDLSVWFMQTYGDYKYEPEAYVEPVDYQIDKSESIDSGKELKIEQKEIEKKLAKIKKTGQASAKRRKKSYVNASHVNLTEAQTRELIDSQLRSVGWEADTVNFRYSKGTRPEKGLNKAIAEWPTESNAGNFGLADYVLFVGVKLVGIIEAKKKHSDISSVLDGQCKDYAKLVKQEHQKYIISKFGDYYVPFLYATNGRPYIKQFDIKSGIWYLDVRDNLNTPKALAGWPSPQGLIEELEKDIQAANKKLLSTGYEVLEDADGLNLRPYQIEAIKATEKAINSGSDKVLLAMATGTGKTRTVLGMIYRFLDANRFKRILYLVDRTALGDQTLDTFKEIKLKELLTLNQMYDIKDLEEKEFDSDTRVHIITVQSLVKRILYPEGEYMPATTDYDLIIVDEAHRGYILDKEMGETEELYRNQDDFRSKYRSVIDYFDSVKIALTATPALHTVKIFGKPVFTYDYRTAVIDGYLVDHDVPHKILTKLTKEGIKIKAGETPCIYDPVTNVVTNGDELEDDLEFDVDDFNRNIVNENVTETILIEIVKNIDPNDNGKTLIFAVDDEHADMIVKILKNLYAAQGVSEDAVMKITGSIGNGNRKKITEAIKKFKNETYPSIVVTVDLLTTGIDVEEIVNIVFMRRVRSRILFEQMLGRATRLCPEICKTHFEIYDAVMVYEALVPVSTMKPVVVKPNEKFDMMIDGFDALDNENQKQNQIDILIAKMRRNIKGMSKKNREQFKVLSGGYTPEEFMGYIRHIPVADAVEYIKKNKTAFEYVYREYGEKLKVISNEKDELVSHTRSYGAMEKPEDYLRAFHEFVNTHLNEILALDIVMTRPKELTRESLKELKLVLDRNDFSERKLQTAWKDVTNQEIAADIISFIRQKSIGDTLISTEERVRTAIEKVKINHPELTKVQINWLVRIEGYLIKEYVLNRDTFETPAFKLKGGFKAINMAFGKKLDAFIDEINENMYNTKQA